MSDRRLAAQSGLWSIILQWSRFGINTLVFLVLARWLSLEEIGAFAIAFAPINLIQLVQRAGFSETIVQGRKEASSFASTVFWMSASFGLAMSFVMFCVSFFLAPLVESQSTGTYLAAMSVIPALIGLAAVPEGLLRQRLEIRSLAIRTTVSTSVAGGLAIWLGHAGYGGWALTGFAIVNAFLSSVLVTVLVRWRPSGRPRMSDARNALPVLGALSGRSLVINATMPTIQLMVGTVLGPAAAGSFQIAHRFLTLAATATVTPLQFATLPLFVRVRDDAVRLRRTIVKTSGLVSVLCSPVYFGLLGTAPLLVPLAVGETNGEASVRVLQAMLLVGGHVGFFRVFAQALTAVGRADIALQWSTGLFIVNVTLAAIFVQFSTIMVALGFSLLGYVAVPLMLRLLHAHTGVAPLDMAKAVFGPVLAAVTMAICILVIGRALSGTMHDVALLAVQVVSGVVIYSSLSFLVSRDQIITVRTLLANLLPERS